MEGEHDGNAFEFAPLAAGLADGEGFVDEAAGGGGAQADDELGLNDGDLAFQEGDAAGHFLGGGDAVARGAAFDDVADENLVAGVAHAFNHPGEELSGAANEGESLFVFVGAGAFANEQDVGAEGPLAGDDVLPGGGEGAAVAGFDFLHKGQERRGNRRARKRRWGGEGCGRRRRGMAGGGFGGGGGGSFCLADAGGGDMGEALFLEELQVFNSLVAEGWFHGGGTIAGGGGIQNEKLEPLRPGGASSRLHQGRGGGRGAGSSASHWR